MGKVMEDMITVNLAEVRIGMKAAFDIHTDEVMQQFLECTEDENICDEVFEIKSAKLPQLPDSMPIYENTRTCFSVKGDTELVYYRLPNEDWQFCMEKRANGKTLYVRPDCQIYAENIWNLIDKIEVASLLLKHKALILHASYIIYKGEAILFTAPSGTGKTTQAELWKEMLGAEIINGDRVILRMEGGRLRAYGLPFSGSSGICVNREAPVRTIVVLEQAKENTVRRLKVLDSIGMLYSQTAVQRWRAAEVSDTLEVLETFIESVPIVKLCCLPNSEAVYELEKEIYEECTTKAD